MHNFRKSLKGNGYDPEEAYFYALEQELIAKVRSLQGTAPALTLYKSGVPDDRSQNTVSLTTLVAEKEAA